METRSITVRRERPSTLPTLRAARCGGSTARRGKSGGRRRSPATRLAGGGVVVATRDGDVCKLDLGSGSPQGETVIAGTKVDANLTGDGSNMVYVSPTSAILYVVDASGPLSGAETYPLPQ